MFLFPFRFRDDLRVLLRLQPAAVGPGVNRCQLRTEEEDQGGIIDP